MAMDKNLPTEQGTFAVAEVDKRFQLPAELREAVTDEDFEGYEDEGQCLPIVSIRQRDLKDDKGKLRYASGGFKIYDPVTDGNQPADVPGDVGLVVTLLADQNSRVYFADVNDDKPKCISADGLNGVGAPGGVCADCQFAQIVDGRRGKCSAQKNVLVRDYKGGGVYVFRLGPSGLTPYRHLKNMFGRMKTAPATMKVKILSFFKDKPQPHYVPEFHVLEPVEVAVFKEIKALREQLRPSFKKTIDLQDKDDETERKEVIDAEFDDIPTPPEPETGKGDDGLPF